MDHYKYDMEDIQGETATIHVHGETATLDYPDWETGGRKLIEFPSEAAAYAWAYNRGFRD